MSIIKNAEEPEAQAHLEVSERGDSFLFLYGVVCYVHVRLWGLMRFACCVVWVCGI